MTDRIIISVFGDSLLNWQISLKTTLYGFIYLYAVIIECTCLFGYDENLL